MKKILFSTVAAIACAAFVSSCSSEINDTLSEKKQMKFSAEFETTALGSRTALNATNDVVWKATDKIAIFDGTNVNEFSLTGGAETKNATFEGSALAVSNYYAIYPYQNGIVLDGNVIKNVVVPAEQKAVNGNIDPTTNVMVATSTTTHLPFKNATSYAKIVTDRALKSIEFEAEPLAGANTIGLAGTCDITVNSGDAPTYVITANATNKVKIVPASGTTFAAGTYYIALLPNKFGSIKVVCTDANDKTIIKQKSGTINNWENPSVIVNLGSIAEWVWTGSTQNYTTSDFVW